MASPTPEPAIADPGSRADLVRRTVYRPLRQGSAVAEAVAHLGQAIGMGLLRAGDRLPSEAELAEDLGISVVTLRSALAMLRGAGVIETRRGRGGGTFISDLPPPELLGAAPRLPREAELRDLIDYRAAIEGATAALATERAGPAALDEAARLCDELEQIDAYPVWSQRDTMLHLFIADLARSPRLVRAVADARGQAYRLGQQVPVPKRAVALADREHRAILKAMRSGRPDRARAAMERHVRSTGALWLGLGRVPADGGDR